MTTGWIERDHRGLVLAMAVLAGFGYATVRSIRHGRSVAVPVESERRAPSGLSQVLAPLREASRSGIGSDATSPTLVEGEVIDDQGQPVSSSMVTWRAWEARAAPESVECRTTTGPAGRFRLEAMPGLGVLSVSHPDWVPIERGPLDAAESRVVRLVLTQGWRLRGQVVGPQGEPIEGAALEVSHAQVSTDGAPQRRVVQELRSGPEGRFASTTLPRLPVDLHTTSLHCSRALSGIHPSAEEILVRLLADRLAEGRVLDAETGLPVSGARVAWERFPTRSVRSDERGEFALSVSPEDGQVLIVASEDHLAVEIAAHGDRPEIRLRRRPVVVGTVVGANGEGVPDARVEVLRGPSDDSAATRADGEGRFRLALPFESVSTRLLASEGQRAGLSAPFPARAGVATSDLRITLAEAGLEGLVTDLGGVPLPGASLRVWSGEDSLWERLRGEPPLAETASDEEGTFRLSFPEGGTWSILCERAGYAPGTIILDARRGDSRRFHRFALAPGLRLVGGVLDPAGAPIEGAEVACVGLDAFASVVTGEDGGFAFGDLPASPLRVFAWKEGFTLTGVDGILPASSSPLTLRLRKTCSLHGTVFDALDGRPVTTFSLAVLPADPVSGVIADLRFPELPFVSEVGTFELENPWDGPCHLRLRADGYATWEGRAIDCDAGFSLAIPLERGLTLAGTVVDLHGQPVERAEVRIYREARPESPFDASPAWSKLPLRPVSKQRTGLLGDFVVTGLSGERLRIRVEAHGFQPEDRIVEPRDMASAVEIRLREGSTLRGRVWWADGRPCGGATVFASQPTSVGSSVIATQADETGTFELNGLLDPFEHILSANAKDEQGELHETRLVVQVDGNREGVELVLP